MKLNVTIKPENQKTQWSGNRTINRSERPETRKPD